MSGFVTLVGAGPGDPELLTLRGRRALDQADAIVYDDLVDRRLLMDYHDRELYPVGDRRRPGAERQQYIFALLAQLTDRDLRVVRLKGGDPLLFARGAEELQFLRQRNVPYEIVPGITAAFAAAAYAEVPLTERGLASSVALCTGHQPRAVPTAGTLVYYMAAATAPVVAAAALAAGWDPATQVTAVSSASRPEQQVIRTELAAVAAGDQPLGQSPLALIIGPGGAPQGSPASASAPAAAAAAAQNGPRGLSVPERSWFMRQPKVLVVGLDASPYRRLGEVVHTPLVRIVPPADAEPLAGALSRVSEYSHLAFTSGSAVAACCQRLLAGGADLRALAGIHIGAVGASTAAALRGHGLRADLVAPTESGAGLAAAYESGQLRGARMLLPRSELADDALPAALRRQGAQVDTVVAYRNVPVDDPPHVMLEVFAAVVFTAPSTVAAFAALYGSEPPATLRLLCRGKTTLAAVRAQFGRGEVLSPEASATDVSAAPAASGNSAGC